MAHIPPRSSSPLPDPSEVEYWRISVRQRLVDLQVIQANSDTSLSSNSYSSVVYQSLPDVRPQSNASHEYELPSYGSASPMIPFRSPPRRPLPPIPVASSDTSASYAEIRSAESLYRPFGGVRYNSWHNIRTPLLEELEQRELVSERDINRNAQKKALRRFQGHWSLNTV